MKYDVVIIGSGLGGLESAYILSKEGYSVCVLEKNRQFGGSLQIFVRDKAIFDTGIHYVGGLSEGQNLHTCFRYFDILDKMKLHKLDMNGYDRISFDDDPTDYLHAQGYEHFVDTLHQQFPKEKQALQSYADKMQEVCRNFPLYQLQEGMNIAVGNSYLETNTKDFIAGLTQDQRLRSVLAGSNPLYAGDGNKTPLYVHALVLNTYIESSYKCVDGGAQIERLLTKNIRANGGTVRNYAEVAKIVERNGKVVHVELTDGEVIEADHVISNIHPSDTMHMLETDVIKKAYKTRLMSFENSVSTFMLDIVLKPTTFPYLNYNRYHFKQNDVWSAVENEGDNWPQAFFVFVPKTSHSDQFADSISIMTYMKFEEVEKWANTFSTIPRHENDRGEDYEAFKKERSERLIEEVEKRIPGLKAAIHSYTASTPLTYRDYLGSKKGGLYGIQKDYQNPMKTLIAPRTKIPNLYFTGQNLNMHGVLGVTIGAIRTCGEFLGENYLLNQINKHR